ncbi:MAG TPA: alpha/beta hydrolase [Candidatus Limivivens merdigallinarum]|uniref:Alpha/beta hydrolase n=1 Tax=Candidatus Limivivens merdigallinarum TaxID=2840859 RepID=A0A9D0ZUI0_9FIRM|nr:alpha/beta hydrolase [Candidatus Limivivens merdigallinarum]
MYKFIETDLQKQKKEIEAWYQKLSREYPLPEQVRIERDIPYLKDGRNCHRMDIYYPQNHNGRLPVLMDFHGGGLLLCDKKVNQWFCSQMAQRGFLVFCIDYPLVPESDVYGILKDSYAGVREAYGLIERYGGDKEAVALCGDSAGALIAVYLAALQKNERLAKILGITPSAFEFGAVAAISGMFYTGRIDRQGIFILRKYFYGKGYRKHPFWKYVNPEHEEILEALPNMFLTTSQGDYLRTYTLSFAAALKRQGKETVLKDYGDATLKHDFVCMQPEREEAGQAMDELADFLKNR